MKSSGVFLILSLLFAISFALPAKWSENDELTQASNDNEVQQKRIAPFVAWALVKAKRAALGYAIRKACNSGRLPSNVKGICSCASLVAGDEEAKLKERKRWWGSVLSKLKSTVRGICNSWIAAAIGGACQCARTFV